MVLQKKIKKKPERFLVFFRFFFCHFLPIYRYFISFFAGLRTAFEAFFGMQTALTANKGQFLDKTQYEQQYLTKTSPFTNAIYSGESGGCPGIEIIPMNPETCRKSNSAKTLKMLTNYD